MIYQSDFSIYSAKLVRAIFLTLLLGFISSPEIIARTPNIFRQSAVNPAWRDGALDTSFAPVLSQTRNSPGVYKTYPLPDGKIFVMGGFKVANGTIKMNLARLNADGTLDNSFAGITVLGTDTSQPTTGINQVLPLPDGKILIGGNFNSINNTVVNHFARLNSDGTLDTSFIAGTGFNSLVKSFVVQTDGKILVAGNFTAFSGVTRTHLARLHADGTLDTTLNATISSGWSDKMNSVAIQPDGKILIQGSFNSVNSALRRGIARLNADGTLDASFVEPGTYSVYNWMYTSALRPDGKIYIGGFFEIRVNNQLVCQNLCLLNSNGTLDTSYFVPFDINNSVRTMYLQPDGRLLVHGTFTTINNTSRSGTTRLNANGSIDQTFNPNFTTDYNSLVSGNIYNFAPTADGGYLVSGIFNTLNGATVENLAKIDANGNHDASFAPHFASFTFLTRASAIQPDGKILISGDFNRANGVLRGRIARFHPNGTLDAAFDASISGSQPASSGFEDVNKIAVQADGKILLGGAFARINGETHAILGRVNQDGSTDSAFNPILSYEGSGGGDIYSITLQPDGKIIIGGAFQTVNGVARKGYARLNPDGTLDSNFIIPFEPLFAPGIHDVLIQPDGKIIIGGIFRLAGNNINHSVARLNADGSLDATFALQTDANATPYLVRSLAFQPDGKILAGGSWTTPERPLLKRLNADGTPDATFVAGRIGFGFNSDQIYSIMVQPNGKILIGGGFSNINNNPRSGIARLTQNGALDFSFQLPAVSNIVDVNQAADGSLIITGGFERIGTSTVTSLARVQNKNITRQPVFDFDFDGKTDISIFRPSAGEWWVNRSSNGLGYALKFGSSTDKIVPADFTGDGKTDIAFFRPSSGAWFVLRSENNSFYSFPFGANGDVPVAGDFDSDGRADAAVFRPSNSTWYINKSTGGVIIQQFGQTGDVPVAADYDDDGNADIAVYRVASGEWWIQRSRDGLIAFQFGNSTDKPVPADYSGDGKADVALWRPSTGEWFVLRSENQSYFSAPFGSPGDIPSAGDYDGDGLADFAVFRPSNAAWYMQRSTAGTSIQSFGQNGDVPTPSAFVP
jgi:uncharacterized delta-60 repeat protein